MRHPKVLVAAYGSYNIVGVLSAKGSVDLYDFKVFDYGNLINLPDWPAWNNLKDIGFPLCSFSGYIVNGTYWYSYIRTAVGVTKTGELLSYGNTTYYRHVGNNGDNITTKETKCSALSGMSGVDRLLLLNLGSNGDLDQNYIYSVTAYFFKDGSAKAVLWFIRCYNGVVTNKSSTISFEGNDIVDIRVSVYGTYSDIKFLFLLTRKDGTIESYGDEYSSIGIKRKDETGESFSDITFKQSDRKNYWKLALDEYGLKKFDIVDGASSVYIDRFNSILVLQGDDNALYTTKNGRNLRKIMEDYYCRIPGGIYSSGVKSGYANRVGDIYKLNQTYGTLEKVYSFKENLELLATALFEVYQNGGLELVYINKEGKITYKANGYNTLFVDYFNKSPLVSRLYKSDSQGLLTSKTPVNLLDKTSVSGFTVKGIEPANTKRRVAFKVEDKWNKLSAEGALTPLTTQKITADSVLEDGNTVAELEAITITTGLAGKLIYPAVALYADPEAEVMPTFGMTVKAEIDTTVNVYSYTGYSQEYNLSTGEDVQVINVVAETETTGEGNVVVTARLKQGGEWTDYMALSDTAMKQASALQLKAVYTVTNTDGSQSAKVKNVTIRYTTSGATVNGVPTDIVTKTQRFTNDLVYAHCYVKHKKLQDAVIDAYCSLRKRPKSKSMYQFGNGTGALNTYKLPDAGINQDTLSVYVDGKVVYDFGYNTETSEITLTADKDTALSASYECGWEMSEWIKMVQGVSQINDGGGYTTEYSYTVPTHEGYEYTVTAIKYSLVRPEGKVTEEAIGVGTGKRQMIELPHFAKKESIVCNGAWSYDYDRKLLTVIAPEGEDIVISYDWIAETPTVYAISAGWAD